MNISTTQSGPNSTRETNNVKKGSPLPQPFLLSPGIHAWDRRPRRPVVAPLGAQYAWQTALAATPPHEVTDDGISFVADPGKNAWATQKRHPQPRRIVQCCALAGIVAFLALAISSPAMSQSLDHPTTGDLKTR